jgi:RNA dependent RNA polymerase
LGKSISHDKSANYSQQSAKSRHEESKASSKLSSHITANEPSRKSYFKMEDEPIFDSILLNMVLGHAVNIKKKARIKIKDSCVLIGVIDESGLLEENEIHLRIEPRSFEIDSMVEEVIDNLEGKKQTLVSEVLQQTQDPITITGRVMVTKNPCSHPGDIRILNAIDCESDPRFEGKEQWQT